MTTTQIIKYGLASAGIVNIAGVLLFSRLFSNSVLNQADPHVMSNFGLLMIMVWGLVYWASMLIVERHRQGLAWLCAVFAIEKCAYVIAWSLWISNNALASLFEQDLFAGLFYSIYGVNDLLFMLFFIWVFLINYRQVNYRQVNNDQ